MPDRTTSRFFADLPVHRVGLSELLADEARFATVPADWHVVVTDIEGSTQALAEGLHETVNLVATGSIIATLNLARAGDFEVPFFFGGDGATLLVPPVLHEPVVAALRVHSANSQRSFGLTLRVGSVPVEALLRAGADLRIGRLQLTPLFVIPVFLGDGLSAAEAQIKGEDSETPGEEPDDAPLDLTGMECRWDRIAPEQPTKEVVSLLVSASPEHAQAVVFKQVIDALDAAYGPPGVRNPVSAQSLNLTGRKMGLEMRTRLGGFRLGYWFKNWLMVQLGKLVWRNRDAGRRYVEQLIGLTDTLVIDGRINTVIAGTSVQREELTNALAEMEDRGLITYGLFVSRESVMSCYVQDRNEKHVHFVDGSDGGYTMAARMWKQKRRA